MDSLSKLLPSRLGLSALLGALLVVGLAAGISAAAQERPNCTGEYVLDLGSSKLHQDYAVLESGTVSIEHREPSFTFRRTFVVNGKPNDVSYVVSTDGRDRRRPGPAAVNPLRRCIGTSQRWSCRSGFPVPPASSITESGMN